MFKPGNEIPVNSHTGTSQPEYSEYTHRMNPDDDASTRQYEGTSGYDDPSERNKSSSYEKTTGQSWFGGNNEQNTNSYGNRDGDSSSFGNRDHPNTYNSRIHGNSNASGTEHGEKQSFVSSVVGKAKDMIHDGSQKVSHHGHNHDNNDINHDNYDNNRIYNNDNKDNDRNKDHIRSLDETTQASLLGE